MASSYPAALDALDSSSTNNTISNDIHPALHNDANDAINAVQETLGINPQGSQTDVATRIASIENALTITNTYLTGSHTWTKNVSAKRVDVILVGAGGGGSSGQCQNVNTTGVGGGGGSSGAIVFWSFEASELPSSVTINVSASTGGTAVGPVAGPAVSPTQPSDTTFGSILTAKSGLVGSTTGVAGGSQSNVSIIRGGTPFSTNPGTSSGMPATNASVTCSFGAPTPGGGGGGTWNSGISYAGGNGGIWATTANIFQGVTAAAGGTIGSAGAAGQQWGFAGFGGGGGGSSHTGNGGAGGAGGFPGGGGGGGGGCWAGSVSGAGGKGGDGVCIVVQYL